MPWECTPQEVASRRARDDEELLLIDCRTDAERAIASIEGAMAVPDNEVMMRLPELRKFDERAVVVFCHHGVRSMHVAIALREDGFQSVQSMAGGIQRWSLEVDPNTPTY